ncbi:techylectin-5A [Trichonephila clavipes]|nr:techylectin-5A [Trichonephila clavipes]
MEEVFNGLEDQSENLTTHLFSLEPLKDKHTRLVTEIGKQHKPTDCTEILEIGQSKSGVYTIWPTEKELEVFCDMNTDDGGWTVIQRRGNFSKQEDFYLDWESYKRGFGNITKEFWLGNENIYAITNQSKYEVRFDLEDADGNHRFGAYNSFRIDSEENDYTLHIGSYTSGEAGDSLTYHNGYKFSTRDKNNQFCAQEREAGWWYDYCTKSNLNGVFIPGVKDKKGITWYSWLNHYSLAGSEIKLRRKNE